jgi:5'-deoxynucleotidase YfbR-like HD superfamily hydrolase
VSQAWIETSRGIKFDVLAPTVDMIDIEDIAHALSQMNRFTGHCKFPYPVSQHSRLASYLVPQEHALWALLHDGSEAFIGDMSRPLKHFSVAGDEYRKVEKRIQDVICDKFGLSREEPPEVKRADNMMLYAEKAQLMSGLDWSHKWAESEEQANVKIVRLSFDENKYLFLARFHELYKGNL